MRYFTPDLDMRQLDDFMSRMDSEDVRIVHRRVKMPSPSRDDAVHVLV